jgi:hypothetical protein
VVFRFRCEGNVPDFKTLQNEIRQCATRWAA